MKEMGKKAVIVLGYSRDNSRPVLATELEENGYEVVVAYPFKEVSNNFFFRKLMLTRVSTEDIVASVKRQIPEEWENFDLFSISYGAIPHAIIEDGRATRNIFMSPAIGEIRWSSIERGVGFFSWLFPAMESMKNEKFKKEIFRRISHLNNPVVILPKGLDDGRVAYNGVIEKINDCGEVFAVAVEQHNDPIKSREVSRRVLEILKIKIAN